MKQVYQSKLWAAGDKRENKFILDYLLMYTYKTGYPTKPGDQINFKGNAFLFSQIVWTKAWGVSVDKNFFVTQKSQKF